MMSKTDLWTPARIVDGITQSLCKRIHYIDEIIPALFGLRPYRIDISDIDEQTRAHYWELAPYWRKRVLHDAVYTVAMSAHNESAERIRNSGLRIVLVGFDAKSQAT